MDRSLMLFAACLLVPPGPTAAQAPAEVARPDDDPARRAFLREREAEWPSSTPEAAGFDAEALRRVEAGFAEIREIKSLLIVRERKLVVEKYPQGEMKHGDALHVMNSATKGVTAALVGIALREGVIRSLDQEVSEFLPEFFPPGTDPRKRRTTLRHLLTMTTGVKEDDLKAISGWFRTRDPLAFAMGRPQAAEPGTTWSYDDPSFHMLSVILTRASGMSTLQFADRHLFGPLGINRRDWPRDTAGYHNGGSFLALRPRDMAKIGQLHLDRGRRGDRQVIPEAWVDESTRALVTMNENVSYGFAWIVGPNKGEIRFQQVSGFGGQFIVVYPTLRMVAVVTADTEPDTDERFATARAIGKLLFDELPKAARPLVEERPIERDRVPAPAVSNSRSPDR